LLFEISIFPSWVHLLSLLAIIGLIFSLIKKNSRSIVLFLLFLLYCTQYALIIPVDPRYRMPFDWILMLFASYGLIKLLKVGKIKQWESFINKKEVPKKIANKLKTAGTVVFLGLIGISLLRIVPRYYIDEVAIYPEVDNQIEQLSYTEILEYQKKHKGDITPYVGSQVTWKGEVSYINHNSYHPLGSAKDSDENLDPKYQGFYDIHTQPSTAYSTFSLTINRGVKPHYYGDGIVRVNYKGSLLNKLKDGDKIAVIGKIIGQNYYYGQIYLEGYEIIF